MQFKVPQFIEMDDKIFGPFTFKQFVYIVGGVGLGFTMIRVIPTPFNYPLALGAVGIGLAFAMIEIHGKPFIFFVGAFVWYITHKKLYIWKKINKPKKQTSQKTDASLNDIQLPAVSANKLKDLAWGLDINEHIAQARMKEEMKKREIQNSDLAI